jgi:hypothetical protein
MDDKENKKSGPQRLSLSNARAARHTLTRLIRLRFNGKIDSQNFRDLTYALNVLLGFDKLEKQTELAKLENKQGGIVFSPTLGELTGLDRAARDTEIRRLLVKCGYMETPQADVSPEPVPSEPVLASQAQGDHQAYAEQSVAAPAAPRRLKL